MNDSSENLKLIENEINILRSLKEKCINVISYLDVFTTENDLNQKIYHIATNYYEVFIFLDFEYNFKFNPI